MNKRVLHWSYRDFKDIPKELHDCEKCLEDVYLKENFIVAIPKWFLELKHLKFIHLTGNLLKELPHEIDLLENLEFLDVSNNALEIIPETIGRLQRLQHLNISANNIKRLPKTIGDIHDLRSFNVSSNMVADLPLEFGHCQKLFEIILNDNPLLESIPENISGLPSLWKFCAERTGLLYLPGLISNSIMHLRIFNNRFISHIPVIYEIFFRNFYSIFEYPQERILRSGSSSFVVIEKDSNTCLSFSLLTRQTKVVNGDRNSCCSLFEYCLRSIFAHKAKGFEFESNSIPDVLQSYVEIEPCPCNLKPCDQRIFSEFYLLVLRRSPGNTIFTGRFCTSKCASEWLLENKHKYYIVEWERL